jgi:hypothetical protein
LLNGEAASLAPSIGRRRAGCGLPTLDVPDRLVDQQVVAAAPGHFSSLPMRFTSELS